MSEENTPASPASPSAGKNISPRGMMDVRPETEVSPPEEKKKDAKVTSYQNVTDKAPKCHRAVIAKAPGFDASAAVRKPEGWYHPGTNHSLAFEPKEWKDA